MKRARTESTYSRSSRFNQKDKLLRENVVFEDEVGLGSQIPSISWLPQPTWRHSTDKAAANPCPANYRSGPPETDLITLNLKRKNVIPLLSNITTTNELSLYCSGFCRFAKLLKSL